MRYNDFENNVKQELSNAQVPVQMDALLGALNIGQEKPSFLNGLKRKLALWMIIPALLIGMLTIYGATNMLTDEASSNQSSMAIDAEKDTPTYTPNQNNTTKEITAVNSDVDAASDNNNIQSETNTENQQQNNTTNEDSTNEDTTNEKQELSKKANTTLQADNQNFNSQEQIQFSKSQSHNNETNDSDGYAIRMTAYQNKRNINNKKINKNQEAANNDGTSSFYLNKDATPAHSNTNYTKNILSYENMEATKDNDQVSIVAPILLHTSSVPTLENERDSDALFKRMKINCPSFDKAAWHLGIVPEIGAFVPHKYLSYKNGEPSSSYIRRNRNEETLEGLNVGLYGMLVRDDMPFFIKSGISYSRITEKMNHEYSYTTSDTIVGVISSTVSANGDTITNIYGNIIQDSTFNGTNVVHHSLHLMDIPLSVGVTTYIAGLDVSIEGGVKFNIMTKAKGQVLKSDQEFSDLSSNQLFKQRIGISYFGGLMIGRNFGRYGDIYLAPRFNYFKDDFTTASNPVSQRYLTFGLNAGVVIKL